MQRDCLTLFVDSRPLVGRSSTTPLPYWTMNLTKNQQSDQLVRSTRIAQKLTRFQGLKGDIRGRTYLFLLFFEKKPLKSMAYEW